MGFRPSLVTTSLGISAEAAFLASEHLMVKRAGATFAAALVGADANGDKILVAGTVVAPTTSGGSADKWGAYDNTASDGRESAADGGFLLEAINLRNGDVIAGVLMHGSVLKSRVSGFTSSALADLGGRFVFQ